jgi:CBS domain-containing protein
MKIGEVMTKEVVILSPRDSILYAMKLLGEKKISGAPVVKEGKVVGILTDSDIMRFLGATGYLTQPDHLAKYADKLREASKNKVETIMKREVVTLKPSDDINEAIRVMNQRRINRIPVVNEEGKLVGIVARGDLVRALAKKLVIEKAVAFEEAIKRTETEIDKLLKLIEEREKITVGEASKELEVPAVKIRAWGKVLQEHGLIEMHYPIFGDIVLMKKKVI